ncbi:MAG: 50S ribosomal protein L3 [Chlamydiota bacterium]
MSLTLMGRKKGMMQMFDDNGNVVVCTVIHAEPNVISEVITKEKQGYNAVRLSAFKLSESKKKNISKGLRDAFALKNIEPRRKSKESRVLDTSSYALGEEVSVGYFSECAYVDVCGISKGKGYQGVIKRHHFRGGPASHGSGFHRHGGSCGMRSTPGRCLPGQKKAGRMGAEKVTVQNLKVIKVDEEKQVILVEGAIPGANEAVVYIAKAKKKTTVNVKKK